MTNDPLVYWSERIEYRDEYGNSIIQFFERIAEYLPYTHSRPIVLMAMVDLSRPQSLCYIERIVPDVEHYTEDEKDFLHELLDNIDNDQSRQLAETILAKIQQWPLRQPPEQFMHFNG